MPRFPFAFDFAAAAATLRVHGNGTSREERLRAGPFAELDNYAKRGRSTGTKELLGKRLPQRGGSLFHRFPRWLHSFLHAHEPVYESLVTFVFNRDTRLTQLRRVGCTFIT